MHGRIPILPHCLTGYAGVVVLACHHIVFDDWRRPMMKVQRLWNRELKFETLTRSKDHRGIINSSKLLFFIFYFLKGWKSIWRNCPLLCWRGHGKIGGYHKMTCVNCRKYVRPIQFKMAYDYSAWLSCAWMNLPRYILQRIR